MSMCAGYDEELRQRRFFKNTHAAPLAEMVSLPSYSLLTLEGMNVRFLFVPYRALLCALLCRYGICTDATAAAAAAAWLLLLLRTTVNALFFAHTVPHTVPSSMRMHSVSLESTTPLQ